MRRSDTPPVAIWVATLGVLLVATAGAALDADAGSGSVLRHEAQGKIAFETLTSISGEKQGPWRGDIWVVNPDGTGRRNLTRTTGGVASGASWSPDGRKIAYSLTGEGGSDIFVMSADGTANRRITRDGHARAPAYSPDGRHIAFLTDRNGTLQIAVVPASGGVSRQLTHGKPIFFRMPAWSPDGRKIAFAVDEGNVWPVYVINAEGSNMRMLTGGRTAGPCWSPDGQQIAFQRYMANIFSEIYVIAADGTQQRRLTRNTHEDWDFAWVAKWSDHRGYRRVRAQERHARGGGVLDAIRREPEAMG